MAKAIIINTEDGYSFISEDEFKASHWHKMNGTEWTCGYYVKTKGIYNFQYCDGEMFYESEISLMPTIGMDVQTHWGIGTVAGLYYDIDSDHLEIRITLQ